MADEKRGPDAEAIRTELDAAHERGRQAYARRDAAAYMASFHRDLEYRQSDGQTIGWEKLASQVRAQLARVAVASSDVRREALEVGSDGTTVGELCEQHARFEVRAFGILHREWSVRRRGRYEWVRSAGGWQIRRVEVLVEDVRSRTWIGL
jgi:hypothetical protein